MDIKNLELQPKWELNKAIELIRELNPRANAFGYHLAIGGSVLINGYSYNDLDIYCHPLGRPKDIENDHEGFVNWVIGNYNANNVDADDRYTDALGEVWRGIQSNGLVIDFIFLPLGKN